MPINAISAPMRVIASATLNALSDASNVCLIGPPNCPTSALANDTTATAAAAAARWVACSLVNAAVGRPTTGFGAGGSGAPSSSARSRAIAYRAVRRCEIATSGRNAHPKNGMPMRP